MSKHAKKKSKKLKKLIRYIISLAMVAALCFGAGLLFEQNRSKDGTTPKTVGTVKDPQKTPPKSDDNNLGNDVLPHGTTNLLEGQDILIEEASKKPLTYTIKAGDTASSILNQWLGLAEIYELDNASGTVFSLRRIRAGQPYSVYLSPDEQQLLRFVYEIDRTHQLVITRKSVPVYKPAPVSEEPANTTSGVTPENTPEGGSEGNADVAAHEIAVTADATDTTVQPEITPEQEAQDLAVLHAIAQKTLESLEHPQCVPDTDDRKGMVETAGFTICLEEIVYDTSIVRVEGEITSNLFLAVSQTGETDSLAIALADIFAWHVDFIRGVRSGDSFTLVVEKRYRDGVFKGYGRITAANFVNQGKLIEAFYFTDENGFSQYYDAKGDSLRRAFLKVPLSFTRISSPFTYTRRHPIFNDVRKHEGIDYAAPAGTPVKAIGNGTVKTAAFTGGYGNLIILKHRNGYESYYAHLSRYAKGVKSGAIVEQGEIIGYVGATGWATGPHLDFRIKKDGKFIDPNSMQNPSSEPISKTLKESFAKHVELYKAVLADPKNISRIQNPDSLVEPASAPVASR